MKTVNKNVQTQENKMNLVRLPVKSNSYSKVSIPEYHLKLEEMGIEIVERHSDDNEALFMQVNLPDGWSVNHEGGYWSHLLDDKGRQRGSFFSKSTWYEQDAFFNFSRRFHISSEQPDYDESLYDQKPKFIQDGDKTEFVPVYEKLNPSNAKIRNDGTIRWERNYDSSYSEYIEMKDGSIRRVHHEKRPVMIPNPEYVEFTGYEKYSQPFHHDVVDCDGTVLFSSDVVQTDFEWTKENHRAFYDNREKKEKFAKQQCENWLNQHYPDWTNPLAHWNE